MIFWAMAASGVSQACAAISSPARLAEIGAEPAVHVRTELFRKLGDEVRRRPCGKRPGRSGTSISKPMAEGEVKLSMSGRFAGELLDQ